MNKNRHVIYLVRHGESESNVDVTITRDERADHAVKLTKRGKKQAKKAGVWLEDELRMCCVNEVFLWSSPFVRAKQTSKRIKKKIEGRVGVIYRETPLLAEIDFGLVNGRSYNERWDGYPDEARRAQIREEGTPSGRFWVRHPDGESQADVATRVHGFFNDIFHTEHEIEGDDDLPIEHIVVAHGATIRAFIHMWTFKEVDWWAKTSNPENCSIHLLSGMKDIGTVFSP